MSSKGSMLSKATKYASRGHWYSIILSELFSYYVKDIVTIPNFEESKSAVSFLRELGYTGVEIPLPFDGSILTGYEEIISSYQMGVSAIATGHYFSLRGYSLTSEDQTIRKHALGTLSSGLSASRELSTPLIIGLIRGKSECSEMSMEWLREALGALDDEAGDLNVRLLVEAINRYETSFLNTISESYALIEDLSLENTGILVDSFHMNIEERDYREAIVPYGDKIWHVHFADGNRSPPSCGHIDFIKKWFKENGMKSAWATPGNPEARRSLEEPKPFASQPKEERTEALT